MERRALVAALAMTLPLALYGVPYVYASTTQSTYVINSDLVFVSPMGHHNFHVGCSSPSDFTQHFAVASFANNVFPSVFGELVNSGLNFPADGDVPNGWNVDVKNTDSAPQSFKVQIICQSPITVAGIGVPQFGSLYAAIALGAVVYFMLSRRIARRPTVSAEVKA